MQYYYRAISVFADMVLGYKLISTETMYTQTVNLRHLNVQNLTKLVSGTKNFEKGVRITAKGKETNSYVAIYHLLLNACSNMITAELLASYIHNSVMKHILQYIYKI